MEEREILLKQACEELLEHGNTAKMKSEIQWIRENLTTFKFSYKNSNPKWNFKKLELKFNGEKVECKLIIGVSYVWIQEYKVKVPKELRGSEIERLAKKIQKIT